MDGLARLFFLIIVRSLWPFDANRRNELLTRLVSHLEYEPKVTKLLKRLRGDLFVDCGANHGIFTLIGASNFRSVYLVEAEPKNAEYLEHLVETRELRNTKVIACAVGDFNGVTQLRHPRGEDANGRYTIEEKFANSQTKYQREIVTTEPLAQIQVRTLEAIIPDQEIDLVKVDVEGAEWRVLRGAEKIMPQIKEWIIDLHDLSRREELSAYMEQFGYRCRWLDFQHAYFRRTEPAKRELASLDSFL